MITTTMAPQAATTAPTHIDSRQVVWVTRGGRPTKRVWAELTATERAQVQEAEKRAAYVTLFNPNGF